MNNIEKTNYEYILFMIGLFLISSSFCTNLLWASCDRDQNSCTGTYACRYEGSSTCYSCVVYWDATKSSSGQGTIKMNNTAGCGNLNKGNYIGGSCAECDTDVGNCGAWRQSRC